MFASEAESAARAHALRVHPNESCGIINRVGAYVALDNMAEDPAESFKLPAQTFRDHDVVAVVHSHIAGRHEPWPTATDMEGQLQTAVPWGIVVTDGESASEPLWFGDFVLDKPLVGRPFQPGIQDCYALIRGWYWQERQVKLPEFPRDENWWKAGGDLLREGFRPAGFRTVEYEKRELGDVVLMSIHATVPNHCGIVLTNGLVLHHLDNRLSRREPLGPWHRFVTHTLRFGDVG